MANDWVEYEVSELCELIVDCVNKTAPKVDYETPYKMLRTTNVRYGVVDTQNCKYVEEHVFEKWTRRSEVLKGDILLTREAPIGEVGRITVDDNLFLGQRLMQYRVNPSLLDSRFLLYSFLSPYLQHQFYVHEGTGSVVSHIRVGDCLTFKIPTPPLPEQKAIAHILGSLDDKIELNRQMNETLEAMAQALFKSWFVDFDPVIDNALAAGNAIPDEFAERAEQRKTIEKKNKSDIQHLFPNAFEFTEEMGWIPKGWGVSKLGEYIEVKRGGSPRPIHDYLVPKGLPWVKISDATASNSRFLVETKQFIKPEGLNKTTLLKKGSLILSNSATPGLPKFLDLDACIHDGWLHFPKKKIFTDNYLYQLFLVVRQELLMQGNGSVFTNLKTDILKNHMVVVPNIDVLNYFDNWINSFHNKIHAVQIDVDNLSRIRDTLLPKLMSGELRISDAAELVEEVV
ncbi:restriction endonuclease subunit S [Psychrobacter sp. AOP30-A2-5]|uniref:restriction endonuclease subunit S n=1 Tax=Psychrobacter sp. AOP30-A2-5 TaxID=3457697 RepID=UPI002628FA5D|nr:restriction endonuclease subunit S [uncultured Psychrobacter sp.]